MTRISWDDTERFYSQGVSMGVLYPKNSPGVPWSGIISVTQKGDDASTPLYIDGQKYRDRAVPGSFAGTISAFTYPDEFERCLGDMSGITAQPPESFGFSYRNNRELHIVYNAQVSPGSDQYETLGDDISPVAFSWDFTTLPVTIPAARASSHLVISLDYAEAGSISDLEDLIYGSGSTDPSLPDAAAIVSIFESHTTLTITDNGDGTWTASGPDDAVSVFGDTITIDWPSVIFLDSDHYRVYSL